MGCDKVRNTPRDRLNAIYDDKNDFKQIEKKLFFEVLLHFSKHFEANFKPIWLFLRDRGYKKSIFSKSKPLIQNQPDNFLDYDHSNLTLTGSVMYLRPY